MASGIKIGSTFQLCGRMVRPRAPPVLTSTRTPQRASLVAGLVLMMSTQAAAIYHETPLETYGTVDAAHAAGFDVEVATNGRFLRSTKDKRRLSTPTQSNTKPIRVKMLYNRIDNAQDTA